MSDGTDVTFLPMFTVTVTAAPAAQLPTNSPPTISGTPVTSVTEGKAYAFQPTASDPDGQVLAFGIANKPAWAAFDARTGRLSGTPATGSAGTYANIAISVSDGVDSASLPAFSITVSAANSPPTISGTPATSVTVSQAYSFQPSASDPDGQTLTFSIASKPAWASFSSSTGRLTGTPAAADAGTYGNIVISVSDGQASATAAGLLDRREPGQHRLGDALLAAADPECGRLAAHRPRGIQDPVRHLAPSAMGNSVKVANPGITSAVIENLSSGTWYFGVVAYNTAGVESDMSSLAQKTIQ